MHFVHSLNEGGIERLLYELCRKINKEKFEIQICCLKERGILYDEFEKLGIDLHNVEAQREFSLKNIYINILKLIQIRKILLQESISITHGHEFYSTIFSRLSALISGVKWRFITLHNVYFWWDKKVHTIQKILSFFTTWIICNSYSTYKYSLMHDKISEKRYRVIYNGIDCSKFVKNESVRKELLREFQLSDDNFICMSVGNISPRKGFGYLLEAVNYLKDKNYKIRFIIVGGKHHEERDEYEKIVNQISKYDLNEIIKITGPRKDVDILLNLCDLYIMPSIVEGFGLALTEAMSMERLVLVSDIEPFKEIVDDGINGFFFKSGDYLSLSNQIANILNLDESATANMKKNARKKIVEKFSLEQMVRNYETLYNIDKYS